MLSVVFLVLFVVVDASSKRSVRIRRNFITTELGPFFERYFGDQPNLTRSSKRVIPVGMDDLIETSNPAETDDLIETSNPVETSDLGETSNPVGTNDYQDYGTNYYQDYEKDDLGETSNPVGMNDYQDYEKDDYQDYEGDAFRQDEGSEHITDEFDCGSTDIDTDTTVSGASDNQDEGMGPGCGGRLGRRRRKKNRGPKSRFPPKRNKEIYDMDYKTLSIKGSVIKSNHRKIPKR